MEVQLQPGAHEGGGEEEEGKGRDEGEEEGGLKGVAVLVVEVSVWLRQSAIPNH